MGPAGNLVPRLPLASWLFGLAALVAWGWGLAAPAAAAVAASGSSEPLEARVLEPRGSDPVPAEVASGELGTHFDAFASRGSHLLQGALWFRLPPPLPTVWDGSTPVLVVRSGLDQSVDVYARRAGSTVRLGMTHAIPKFGGAEDKVFALPPGLDEAPLYVRVQRHGRAVTDLAFSHSTLSAVLALDATHARILAIAFGALMSMAIAAFLVRLVLGDVIFPLYGALFSLQALYLAYFSGQAFSWPLLSLARPFANYASNVTVALSAAAAALFVREFANLRRFSPRVYSAFGWLAVAFLGLAVANVLRTYGWGVPLAAIGNLMFLGSAVFTLGAAFLAWRRGGNRAAGWFLIAWSLLCTFQIITAVRLLYTRADSAEGVLYYGLAPSMVAAAVLIALGVSDHVRQQSLALTDAERRAQTDPLTGVLNRRSLIERLEAACLRAKARKLPLSVLFIDIDHFKQVNDTYGHAAGDACLAAIIPPIQAELRQSDAIGRYGGEEFVVILSGADAAAAHPIAERICRRVEDIRLEGFGTSIRVTCSIGVACSDGFDGSCSQLIALADAAVYAAKRSGRNQVQLAASRAA
ncbi:MAG: diguanylate cyclase [Proteobacteria bacterium]|nr:diguanylate cyclase [Pseudomonadota bacterium]